MSSSQENRTLKFALSPYPTYFEPCCFNEPIGTCDKPGASMESVLLLEKYYHAEFEWVIFEKHGVGAPTENGTMFRAIVDGTVQVGGATLWYMTERLNNLPSFTFPMDSAKIGAVIRSNSSLVSVGAHDTMNVAKQAPIWAVFIALGVFMYFGVHFIDETKKTSYRVSKKLLELNVLLLSHTVLLYLTFTATTITILLFTTPLKHFEFRTFEEMADTLLEGRIKLVAIDSFSATRFISPGKDYAETDETLMKYYKANQIYDRVKMVPNDDKAVENALKYVDSDERVFVSSLLLAQSIPNLCDYEIISNPSFPNALMGFFFNNQTPPWFTPDAPLMQSIGYLFQHYQNKYVVPDRCVKERHRRALTWPQTMTMFYIPLAGMFFGFIALLYELLHYETVKRFQWSSIEPQDMLYMRAKSLISQYNVKTIVDEIYQDAGDVWVCFSPKKIRRTQYVVQPVPDY